jgi:rsbT antagonist protein RsbS
MEAPILKHGDYLIVPIQSALTDANLEHLRDALIDQVGRHGSTGLIVDVTGLDVMDSFATRTLRDIAGVLRLRGAETVIVGIRPDVALAMVRLGLSFETVVTHLDFEAGLAYLNARKTRTGGRPSAALPRLQS